MVQKIHTGFFYGILNNVNVKGTYYLSRFQIEFDKIPREIFDHEIQRELLTLEEQEGSINFKFGIVYAQYGQLTDDEMLSNGLFH